MTGAVAAMFGGDVRGDLVAADSVAVDERPALGTGVRAGVVERVEQPPAEPVEARRNHGPAEPSRGDDDGVERFAVDTPARLDPLDAGAEPDPTVEVERGRVRRR